METKFCEFCGNKVAIDAVVCIHCGKQIEELKTNNSNNNNPQIIINNTNTNTIKGNIGRKECDKWVAFILCLSLGWIGAHKFYEGKGGMGVLYLFTGGLFGIGWMVDCISILCKPNPYYV